MKILKCLKYFFIGLLLAYIPFWFISPIDKNARCETNDYYDMLYIMYHLSQSKTKYHSLYEYYQKGYLYSPWVTYRYPYNRDIISELANSGNGSRKTLLTEKEFSKICAYKLINNDKLVAKYNKDIYLIKIPLEKNAPMVFKRLGFSCLFGKVSKNNELRKNFPAKYFQKLGEK